jgi:cytochrome c oxidase subunit 2
VPLKRRLRWAALPVGIAAAVVLAGCSTTELHGYLPGFTDDGVPTTDRVDMVAGLWVNSWIVLLAVGIVTWSLMLWAVIAYRRRKGQTGLPVQLRYNMPIEIFYTVVPLILVVGFFAFTARDQTILETQYDDPDVSITAYGKQWAWDFQYNGEEDDNSDAVWTMGVMAEPESTGDVEQSELPTLYLPVNKTVQIELQSRDVIHSFWIVDFLYKKDMYIGRENFWSFTPTREGTYAGKCAELCGEYHSAMLFNVEVVSEQEYEDYLETLRDDGQTGEIDEAYDRLQGNTGFGQAEEGKG